jgi:phosphoserine phosphatase RsbU/P
VPAALFATTMRGLLRGLASRSSDPAQLLSSLNRLLYKELSSVRMFITAQIVRVELQSRTVTAASAGHCPLLIIQPGRRAATALPAQGIPIGVLPDTVYHAVTETLGTPAAVLLHTDGLTDTRNSAGKPFGQRRLMAWLRANAVPGRSAAELRDSLTAELEKFRGEAAMADDQAFLLLMEEEVGAAEVPANSRRRIRIQHGSFLFPGNS